MNLTNHNRWRVMRPQRLSVRGWDDELVVYDNRSGNTHILEPAAGRVLARLMQQSASVSELAPLITESEQGPDQAKRQTLQILDILERFRRQGIVKPIVK